MPCGKKRKRRKMNTHKRKKRLRANRHKKKKQFVIHFHTINKFEFYLPLDILCFDGSFIH